jgi:hypothetical protein
MIAFVLGQAAGLPIGLSAAIGVVEGIALTVVLALLAERYVFRMPHD